MSQVVSPASTGLSAVLSASATDPTHVALVTDADVLAGTERHMLELATGLARRGIGVSIACPPGTPLAELAVAAGLDVQPVARRGFATLGAALALRRLLVNGSANVLHAHNGRALFAAAVAVTLAGRGRCVTTQHFLTPSSARRRGLRALASSMVHRFMAGRTHRIIAISESARAAMVARGAPGASKVVVVPNGIAPPPKSPATSAAAARSVLGINAGQLVILCAARLEPEKGIPTLIAAMATVRKSFPTAVCLLAGEGAMREAIEQAVSSAGLVGMVRPLGFRSDVPTLMAAADLFVLPAPAEPFGLVLLEAMSAGRPVVAVAAGGPLEIVVHGETGLLVPPGDAMAMASAIECLLADPGLRRRLAEAGQVRWGEKFTVDRMVASTVAAYASGN